MAEVIVKHEVNPDRYLFARYLRRMIKRRGIRVSDLRDMIGVSNRVAGRWLRDEPGTTRPDVPSEAEAKMIAALLDVPEAFVVRLAERSREALNEGATQVVRLPDGEIKRRKVPT